MFYQFRHISSVDVLEVSQESKIFADSEIDMLQFSKMRFYFICISIESDPGGKSGQYGRGSFDDGSNGDHPKLVATLPEWFHKC